MFLNNMEIDLAKHIAGLPAKKSDIWISLIFLITVVNCLVLIFWLQVNIGPSLIISIGASLAIGVPFGIYRAKQRKKAIEAIRKSQLEDVKNIRDAKMKVTK